MGTLSDFAENELLDHIFNAAYTPPATVYIALCTADPTDAGTGANMNEVANSGAYARQAITFGAATNRRVTQSGAITFPTATASWGTVTHYAIVDSGTHGAGNMLAYGTLATSKQVVANNTPSIADGEVYIEFTAGEITDYLSNKLLDLMFRNVSYTSPSTYVGLSTTNVTDAGAITEPSGGAYARVQVNSNGGAAPTWDVAASGTVDNTHDITFPTATASWGTVVGVFIVDAATGGNVLLYDNDMTDTVVTTDDTLQFNAGDLDITMD